MIPTVEEEHLAFRYYKAQPSAGVNAPQINLTYFDLVVRALCCSTALSTAAQQRCLALFDSQQSGLEHNAFKSSRGQADCTWLALQSQTSHLYVVTNSEDGLILPPGCRLAFSERVFAYMQNGAVIQAQSNLNFSTQQSSFNYSVLSPTVTDLTGYNRSLQSLLKLATGLANGESGNPCAPSDHKLDRYADAVSIA